MQTKRLVDTCYAASYLPIPALLLSGCAAIKVRMGIRVSLEKIPVASVQASLPNGPGIAPGEKSPLVLVITEPNGKTLQTEGKGGGKVMWKDLRVQASVVTVNQKGIVSLPRDPRVSDEKLPHVTITVPSHPGVVAELDVPVRYNYAFSANFSGSSGTNGFNGADGIGGTSGTPGSIDPNNPSPGGNGTDGGNGSDGQDGGRGGDAPPVHVRVTLRTENRGPLLQIGVAAAGRERFYLVDPQGGSLTVKADGGPGGPGGKGGRGGRGGMGGTGTPSGSNGRDGFDGRNGFDGTHGNGGKITVTYDPQAKPYLNLLHLSSAYGPAPAFNEQPVPLLW